MSIGRSIRLYLADGTPGGLLTAEIMNWTGHVVAAPRSDLGALLQRREVLRTGIYLLLGDDPESLGGTLAYIGEGDEVRTRLRQHGAPVEQGGKDFWDRAIVLTSKDANLTKAHARYLESRLISIAHEAGRSRLTNGTGPKPPPLPESDESDMEYFISQTKIILPVLGVNVFRSGSTTRSSDPDIATPESHPSPVFELRVKKDGLVATAKEIDGEFTVVEGSDARAVWTGAEHGYQLLRQRLIQSGVIVSEEERTAMRFARDQVFASPSAAAAVVVGRQANGRVEWKVRGTGISFGAWQSQGIDRPDPDSTSEEALDQ